MILNASIPRLEGFVRAEFLYDLRQGHGTFLPATIFGIASVQGRALGFHALLHDSGAVIWRLPIHALAHVNGAPAMALHELQRWDCFSYDVAVTELEHLAEMRVLAYIGRRAYPGTYRFTVDWAGNVYAEGAGPGGHKCAHLVALDNGNFAALPNNLINWHEPAVVTIDHERPQPKPDFRIMTHTWKCENGAWQTEDSDRMFYDIEANPHA